jgi:hypothetical protein
MALRTALILSEVEGRTSAHPTDPANVLIAPPVSNDCRTREVNDHANEEAHDH